MYVHNQRANEADVQELRRAGGRWLKALRTARKQKRPGSILYKDGIAKIAQFSRACNDDGIPLVWLQDVQKQETE